MPLLRVRFTVRRLMIAVAVVAWFSVVLPDLLEVITGPSDAYYQLRLMAILMKLTLVTLALLPIGFICWAVFTGLSEATAASRSSDPPEPE